MKTLKLKNAKIESLTENKVIFIGELKNKIYKLSYIITKERFEDLKQLDVNTIYNIWYQDNNFRFIAQ